MPQESRVLCILNSKWFKFGVIGQLKMSLVCKDDWIYFFMDSCLPFGCWPCCQSMKLSTPRIGWFIGHYHRHRASLYQEQTFIVKPTGGGGGGGRAIKQDKQLNCRQAMSWARFHLSVLCAAPVACSFNLHPSLFLYVVDVFSDVNGRSFYEGNAFFSIQNRRRTKCQIKIC